MRYHGWALVLWVMVAAGTTPGHLKQGSVPGTQQQKPDTTAKTADYPNEPYIYEEKRGIIRFENDGTGSVVTQARIRIQSQLGLSKVGQLIFPYNAESEDLEIRSVRVTKPDGKIVTAGPDAVQDLSAPVAREAPVYTDAREKHVSVPSLAVGDVLEYEVLKKVKQPLLQGQFWLTWPLVNDAICLHEEMEINGPKGRAVKMKAPPDVPVTTRKEGDREIYEWATATLVHPETFNPFSNFKNFDVAAILKSMRSPQGRQFLFSTFGDWESVARWYEGLEHDRRAPTPEVKAQADEIVKGKTTDLEKAQTLYEWVGRNVRYVSLSFVVGRYQPHAAGEVLSNRYGDCKDKTTLLEAFLEAEGMRAFPALVKTTGEIDADVPSPLQFDHVITYLPLPNHVYWLDPTMGVAPFGYLLPQLRGENALVVMNDEARGLQKTRAEMDVPTIYRVEVKGRLDAEGKVEADVSFATRGDLEVLLRLGYTQITPAMMQNILTQAARQQAGGKNLGISFTNFRADDPTATADPFRVSLHIAAATGKPINPTASPLEEAQTALAGAFKDGTLLTLLPESKGPVSKGSAEWQPVELGGVKEYSLELTFALPGSNSAAATKPMTAHFVEDFAEYESEIRTDGGKLYGKWRLNLRVAEVPGREGKEYAAFCQKVAESLKAAKGEVDANKTTGESPTNGAATPKPPAHTPTPEAVNLGREAEAEVKRQNWAHAAELAESAVEKDPEYVYGWNTLGRARMNMGKYSEAENAFRKILEIEPDEALPYAQLAWSLTLQKKYSAAAELLETRVAKHSNDGDAYRRLGLAYLDLHQPDRAIAALEKATSIIPTNQSAHYYLGQAYLAAGKVNMAAAAFKTAIELDERPGILNDAAYQLSDANASLDLAETWSAKAVRSVETELNQVTTTNIRPRTVQLILALAPYWDTLGWIEFQSKKYEEAEKYVRAAWEMADYPTIGYHLGRIYEAQGKRYEAEEMYAEALAVAPSTADDDSGNDVKDARKRLAHVLGSETLLDARVKDAKVTIAAKRPISIPNVARASGMDQYLLILGSASKVTELRSSNPEKPLAGVEEALREVTLRPTIPDKTLERLPRMGVLTCLNPDRPCSLVLLMATGGMSNTTLLGATPGGSGEE